jgi:hypothetical protein
MFGNLDERGNTNRWADFNAGFEHHGVEVDLTDADERGRTRRSRSGTGTKVAMRVDIDGMRKLLDRVFSSMWRKATEER